MTKNIAIVCNKLAGSGRAIKMAKDIVVALERKDHIPAIFYDDWPTDFSNFTDVFIVGGDGTVNFFINKYPDIKLPLVIFNGGTGNDFHWMLYGKISFKEQLEKALTEPAKPIDIGKCNERYFLNGVGIGFEAAISKALTGKKKLPGKTSFYFSVMKNIFKYRSKNYSIKSEGQILEGKYLLIDIYNGKRAGGGFYIAPDAEANDGLLDIIIAKAMNPIKRLRFLPIIEKGKHLDLKIINYFRTDSIVIGSNDVMQFHLDGEYAEASELKVEINTSKVLFRY